MQVIQRGDCPVSLSTLDWVRGEATSCGSGGDNKTTLPRQFKFLVFSLTILCFAFALLSCWFIFLFSYLVCSPQYFFYVFVGFFPFKLVPFLLLHFLSLISVQLLTSVTYLSSFCCSQPQRAHGNPSRFVLGEIFLFVKGTD